MITQQRLHELFEYKDGELIRKVGVKGSPKGTTIGTIKPSGYKVAVVDGHMRRLHHLIWLYVWGWEEKELDHINRNQSDNRIENLRPCSRAANTRNTRAKSDGYKGVSFCKQTGRWVAQITVNYKNKKIGRFDTPEEAAIAYNTHARQHFGEFAYLNEINEGSLCLSEKGN